LLPTQSYRSERQVDLQQFSTPLHLAWLAAHAARITDADTVLEPSAGTGMLAVHARQLGAQLILNERDPAARRSSGTDPRPAGQPPTMPNSSMTCSIPPIAPTSC
jgi:hypothetical protein